MGFAEVVYALVAAQLVPLLSAASAKAILKFDFKANLQPREFLQEKSAAHPLAARLLAAEKNAYETLPFFCMAVLLALWSVVPVEPLARLAWLYVLLRVAYVAAYAMNLGVMRSVIWTLGLLDVASILMLCLRVL